MVQPRNNDPFYGQQIDLLQVELPILYNVHILKRILLNLTSQNQNFASLQVISRIFFFFRKKAYTDKRSRISAAQTNQITLKKVWAWQVSNVADTNCDSCCYRIKLTTLVIQLSLTNNLMSLICNINSNINSFSAQKIRQNKCRITPLGGKVQDNSSVPRKLLPHTNIVDPRQSIQYLPNYFSQFEQKNGELSKQCWYSLDGQIQQENSILFIKKIQKRISKREALNPQFFWLSKVWWSKMIIYRQIKLFSRI
eukprot:TRINITY_DN4955_c0_g1_i1.p1 TRINITY_DN4955_c0_g1~~TRINITY_DN4955_c0_g1_i1.p1  ORF type:complete len:253 (+),score=-17.62 TRINITY_DN4955_c0_g1_i1:345-1103(+)